MSTAVVIGAFRVNYPLAYNIKIDIEDLNYMSAHVLLNLLNKLKKRDQM